MTRPPRYLHQKYMEPNHSQLINWERKCDRRLFMQNPSSIWWRYTKGTGAVIRNPHKRPLLKNGRKP